MPKQYSRKEFYDLVWSKPITHLAKDFGLSDVAIHKICKKHNIPNPPLGYWAKKAHGKAVTQTPLPRSSKDVADTILIVEGSFLSEPDSLRSAREQARINASAPEAQPCRAPFNRGAYNIKLDKSQGRCAGTGFVRSARMHFSCRSAALD